jgi:hypothetical protein
MSHRTMSISIQGPSHGPQMGTIFRNPRTTKQSYRKYLIQSSYLPLRLVLDLARRQTCPCRIVSKKDQGSIVLYRHLRRLLAHVIHGDLVATVWPKAVPCNTVIGYLYEAKLGTTEVTLDPKPSSPPSTIPTGPS